MSKQLAVIDTAAPVKLVLDDLARAIRTWKPCARFTRSWDFTSLLRDLPAAPAAAPATPSDSAALESPAALKKYLSAIPRERRNRGLADARGEDEREEEGFGSRIAAVEISPKPGVSRTAELDAKGEMLGALGEFLRDPARPKIVHDPKLVELLAGPVAGIRHATMLYSYLLRPTTAKHSLADAVLRQENVTLSGAPGEHAEHLQRLAPFCARKWRRKGSRNYTRRSICRSRRCSPRWSATACASIRKALDAMSKTMEREIRTLEKSIWKLAGTEFNVNSPQQLAEILFDKMGLDARRKAPGENRAPPPRTCSKSWRSLHELPRKVLEYRELTKLKSTYVDALPKLIHAETGRLHTSFSQTAPRPRAASAPRTRTCRIFPCARSSAAQIRAAFVAEPGQHAALRRLFADRAAHPGAFLEGPRAGRGVPHRAGHSRAHRARKFSASGPMAQNAEHRRAAKAINFGIIYGQTPFGLAAQLGIDQKEAAQFIAAYFARYRGVKEYLEHSLAEARKTGVTRTLFGRIRPVPEITSPQFNLRNFAERTALNTPLQGTAADLIKLAMIAIERQLAEQKFASQDDPAGARRIAV